MKISLIDGDICVYRCAAVNEQADLPLARWQVDQLLNRIIEDTQADDWKIYLSGENNFRYQLYPDYKKHRRSKPKPRHLEGLREYLVTGWDAIICDGYEADDALGMESRRLSSDSTTICSIDKDLLQIAGVHYNFVRREIKEVDEFNGTRFFYTQLLTGDSADYIRGCPGVGPAKAEKAFRGCQSEYELYERCCELYRKALGDVWEKELELNAHLLWIWRIENDKWMKPQPPAKSEREGEAPPLSSTLPTNTSSEPTMTALETSSL